MSEKRRTCDTIALETLRMPVGSRHAGEDGALGVVLLVVRVDVSLAEGRRGEERREVEDVVPRPSL